MDGLTGPGHVRHLDELLRRCVVHLSGPGTKGGTGFFVAPDRVLTCAHVVAGAPAGRVEVRLGTETFPGTVSALHPARGADGMYPLPDVAVITVSGMPDHGQVVLDDDLPLLDDRLHCVGFTRTLGGPGPAPELEPVTFTFDGLQPFDGGTLLKLGAGAQATAGMSGGPLLNLRTGRVCGLVKTTRDSRNPYGGWAVPLGAVQECEPALLTESAAAHTRDPRWGTAFATAVRAVPAPAGASALPVSLVRLLDQLPALRTACESLADGYEKRLGTERGPVFRDRLHHLLGVALAAAAPEASALLTARDAALLTVSCAHLIACEVMPTATLSQLVDTDPQLRRRWLRHVDRTGRLTRRSWERLSGLPGDVLPDPRVLSTFADASGPAERFAVSLFLERELTAVVGAAARAPAAPQQDGPLLRPSDPFPSCDVLAGLVLAALEEPSRVFVARCAERFEGVRTVAGCRPLFVDTLLRAALRMRRLLAAEDDGVLTAPRLRITADQGLWRLQQLLVDVQPESDADGETLRLVLAPDSPLTVESVVTEVNALRQVVDQCTAALAQYYVAGRDAGLRLRYPRIRSNVDDPAHYVRKHGFGFDPSPGRMALNVANVLPLLVRPLYGDRPEIGVRELLQNALDAVWARRAMAAGEYADGRVLVALTDRSGTALAALRTEPPAPPHWERWLEVRDNGVGMTTDVIREHFLTAGGSYDPAERARLRTGAAGGPLRIGRFGIGVLAGFLLGAEIQVISRSAANDEAAHFVMREDSDLVELYRCSAPVGTTIRVRLDPATHQRLSRNTESWDWYHFSDPPVTRITVHGGAAIPVESRNPPLDPSGDPFWRWLDVAPYGEVFWTRSDEIYRGRVYVNGIRVAEPRNSGWKLMSPAEQLKQPVISIADRAGACSLTLTRDAFVEYPQAALDAVRRDALREQIAWYVALAQAGTEQAIAWQSPLWSCDLGNIGEGDGRVLGVPFVVSDAGIVPLVPQLLAQAEPAEVYFLCENGALRESAPQQVADLVRLARSVGCPVGLLKPEMYGGFGYSLLSAAVAETFRFGVWSSAGNSLVQLVTTARGEDYARMHPGALLAEEDGWSLLVPPGPAAPTVPPELWTTADRELITELGGYGLLRLVPEGTDPSRPERTAEFTALWGQYGLPALLPHGFDLSGLPGAASDDLARRIARQAAAGRSGRPN